MRDKYLIIKLVKGMQFHIIVYCYFNCSHLNPGVVLILGYVLMYPLISYRHVNVMNLAK